jgi:hypothetical protein
LNCELAAAYRGVCENTFRAMVEAGTMPKPEKHGHRMIYDRKKIDRAWDRVDETEVDPLMEALDDSEA